MPTPETPSDENAHTATSSQDVLTRPPTSAPAEFELPRGALPRSDATAPPRFEFEVERMGTWEFDRASRRLSWSAGFADLFGFAAEEGFGTGEPFLARIHASDRAELLERARALWAGPSTFEFELRLTLDDGSTRWILARGRSHADASGAIVRGTGVAADVSHRRVHAQDLRAKEARLERSERRYRTLVAATSAIVWSMDPEGRLVERQEAWAAFTGQTWEQYRGEGWLAMFHPDDRARVGREWAAIVQSRAFGEVEARLWHAASKAWRRVRARAVPLCAPDGSIEEWIGSNEDIDERVAAAEHVRESEERLRTVLRATNDVVWDWNLAKGELGWSVRYAETFGYPSADLWMTTEECDRRVHPDDRDGLDRSLAAVLEGTGEFWAHEYRYRHANGGWRHVQDRGYVLRDEHGRATRMIGALQDVTQHKKAELELRKAEHLYRGLVHSVKAILWRANAETFCFEFVSKEAARLGYPMEQWLEPGFWAAHVHPDDRAAALACCVEATREHRDHEFEYRFLAADGRVVWFRDVTTVLVSDGRIRELVGILLDVTELKEAQERMRQSEERFRALYEQASVGMVQSGLDGSILDANPAFCAMLGYSREELVGSRLSTFSHQEDWRANLALRDEVLAGRRTHFQMEKRYVRKDGSLLHGRLAAGLVRDAAGKPVCILGIIEDVSEQKQAEQAIREMNTTLERRVHERTAELQSALRELESFSYSVSHDLRAPLRSMDGFSQILLEEHAASLDEAARGWLRRIRANCTNMSHLIDGLLALARLSHGELGLAVIDLGELGREIVDGLRNADPAREVEFVLCGDLRARADPRLARTLLENLLGNAWKFSALRPCARIELFTETGSLGERVYCVRDDGVGFDPDLAGRLFQPFERLHSQAEFPGSGIGLATVQRIVNRHGGDVWIEGVPDRGACVRFTLGTR